MTRDGDSPTGDSSDSNASADPADGAENTPTGEGDQSLLTLPDDLRGDLKDPLGPIETDAAVLLESVDGPLIAVGDVVTYHLLEADRRPDVALVDGYTKRSAVEATIAEVVLDETARELSNPPATITADLVDALVDALADDDPVTLLVDGEEDLATLPAILAAPDGASVVYGQPDVGMVHVRVGESVRADVAALLEAFEGDHEAVLAAIE